jgi:hypothetical protein
VAPTPHHENHVRSYPDDPRPGTPQPTKRGGAKNPGTRAESKPSFPLHIARIETVPMTADELDNAAEALAVLLNHFRREHPDLAA